VQDGALPTMRALYSMLLVVLTQQHPAAVAKDSEALKLMFRIRVHTAGVGQQHASCSGLVVWHDLHAVVHLP
jgi:hypothetical protein